MPALRVASFFKLLSQSRLAITGAGVVTSAIVANLILIVSEMIQPETNAYIGIVIYMLLPGLTVFGLMMIPAGLYLRMRREGRGTSLTDLADLAQTKQIKVSHVLQVVMALTAVNLVALGVVGYHGIHYTDSVAFCGKLCHSVMHPEYTTYSRSPHSQIRCAECHIGPGAGWFVKSKLSGARQVVAVLANTYSRPIETPVENLRPAREVCEVCHRPEVFHGNKLKVIQHFEPDEKNLRTYTVLNMLVGGGDGVGPNAEASGIHWHVGKSHEVRYYATDRKRENIVWIELTTEDGSRRVWTRPGVELDEAEIAREVRTMDCVDCHNRPTHIFMTAQEAMDDWMARGVIDAEIPWIRKLGEEMLTRLYETSEAATAGIAELPQEYRARYPEQWEEYADRVRATVPSLQEIHSLFVYPEMNIQWNTYNSMIGHPTQETSACFRCHNGVLRDKQDAPITLECDACHHVLATREVSPAILRHLETRRLGGGN